MKRKRLSRVVSECCYCNEEIATQCNWFNIYFIHSYHALKCEWHCKTKHKKPYYIKRMYLYMGVAEFLYQLIIACIMVIPRGILIIPHLLYVWLFEEDL